MKANDCRFQGLCLVKSEGYLHMSDFDKLPRRVRTRLRTSPFNLCPACISDAGKGNYDKKIKYMERLLREENGNAIK